MVGIDAAVLRRGRQRDSHARVAPGRVPDPEKALALYTAPGAPKAAGWETGVIAGGKAADLAVYE